jgi:GT2 family glycosyltransferase
MIAFGTAVADERIYETVALPGIQRLAEPDSLVITRHGYDSIQRPYNEMLEEVADRADLEALILVHQDLELTDSSLLERARPLLRDPRVGLVGLFGARSAKLSHWIEGELFGTSSGPMLRLRHSTGSHEVDLVDGALLVIAPWVVRALRFDERLGRDFHGYDVDFSFRVRAAGGRVTCSDVPYVHHMQRPWSDRAGFVRSLVAVRRMWDPQLRPPEWAGAFGP